MKRKIKGIFATFDASDVESDDEQSAGVHTAAGHSDGSNLIPDISFHVQ